MQYTLGQTQLDNIEDVLQADIMDLGVTCVVLIDMSGNIIANLDTGDIQHDIYSLAALAAGNFGAVSAMAKIIGEEEFSLLFHKGTKENIHFSKVMDDFLLVTIFGKGVSLGFLRMKVSEAIAKIEKTLKE
ncbi:MAG: roadblock/LC7 domain-containing protein [Thermodesulfobacteriota bacterium]